MTARCIQCHSDLHPRFTTTGKPRPVSMKLVNMDPDHFFCSILCAAQYGAEVAYVAVPVSTERKALREQTEARRALCLRQRRKATTGSNR